MLWGSLAGCAQHKAARSGFLDNYSQLTPNPLVQSALAYTKPGTNLSQYDKFIVEPISIHFSPNAKGVKIAPAKLAELVQYLEDEAVSAALSMDGEAIDSVTGERILAIVETREGERFSFEGLGPFDHAKQAMRHWVKSHPQPAPAPVLIPHPPVSLLARIPQINSAFLNKRGPRAECYPSRLVPRGRAHP